MVGFRQRERSGPKIGGGLRSTWYNGNHYGDQTGAYGIPWKDKCNDTVMAPPFTVPHSLHLEHLRVTQLKINGDAPSGVLTIVFQDYVPDVQFADVSSADYPDPVDWNYWKAKALANINPFNPAVDIPLFIFELKDFPRMLRDLGNLLLKKGTDLGKLGKTRALRPSDGPGGYLAYQFGWAPLISDLANLLEFTEIMQRQTDLLRAASWRGKKVRRRLTDTSLPASSWEYTPVSLIGGQYKLTVNTVKRLRVWCSARVFLNDSIPPDAIELEAFKSAFGFNYSASALWNAIPWSWLIDYLSNIGTLLEARRGYNRWHFKDLQIMAQSSRTDEVVGVSQQLGNLSFSDGKRSIVLKERSSPTSNPNLSFLLTPMLTRRQVGILGALATASALRGERL